MDNWFRELDQNAGHVPRLLVALLDARTQPIDAVEVPRSEAEELALDYKMPYFEVTLQEETQKDAYYQHLDATYLKLIDMSLEKKGWS